MAAVRARYEAGETDEFIQPIVIGDPGSGRIREGDAAIFFNFRPDRARELTRALVDPRFSEFDLTESARVLNGPAPRRLPALPLKVVDGAPAVAGGFVGRPGFETGG